MMYKLVTRVTQYFCFPERPVKGEDILDFQKGGNLRKGGGGDLEKGGMTPLTNYDPFVKNASDILMNNIKIKNSTSH